MYREEHSVGDDDADHHDDAMKDVVDSVGVRTAPEDAGSRPSAPENMIVSGSLSDLNCEASTM